jgi:hypothetical protein
LSFDVFFISLDHALTKSHFLKNVDLALIEIKVTKQERLNEGIITAVDGIQFKFYVNKTRKIALASLQELSPSVCQCLYTIAVKTRCVLVPLVPPGTATVTLRVVEAEGMQVPDALPDLRIVNDPDELYVLFDLYFKEWGKHREELTFGQ